jgi:hypothetical protein
LVPVAIGVSVSDPTSGAGRFTLQSIAVSDGTAASAVVSGFAVATASTAGSVQAARAASVSSRVYSFTYIAANGAGLTSSCTATITVPHDRSE